MAVRSLERSAVRASPTKRTFRDILLGKRVRRYVDHGLSHLVLLATGLAFFLPFYWLVSTSVKPNNELFLLPPKWIPSRLVWENFPRAWNYLPFATYFKNTLYICIFNVVATIVSCTLTAYGFSRIRWPGRDALFIVLIATMMIPYQVTLVPTFLIFKWIGWVGTFNPLTWPAFTGSAFYIFLLRQFYMTIPLELSEAAKMDGAGELRTFLQIMVPLTRPAMATVALFTFLASLASRARTPPLFHGGRRHENLPLPAVAEPRSRSATRLGGGCVYLARPSLCAGECRHQSWPSGLGLPSTGGVRCQ